MDGRMALYDATNSTKEQRVWILEQLKQLR
jgi:hypothetical protein